LDIDLKRVPNWHHYQKEKPVKDDSTFSTPNIVAEPKTEKAKNAKIRQVNKEKNEIFLESKYLDSIQKLSSVDLGIIHNANNNVDYYPENKKKDRQYNRGVQRAKDDIRLLNFLVMNLKPRYRHQIFSSGEFVNLIQKYLGIDYFNDNFTREEKDQVLALASQMLINSLAVIKSNMSPEFYGILTQIGKDYFGLIEAISKSSKSGNRKKSS